MGKRYQCVSNDYKYKRTWKSKKNFFLKKFLYKIFFYFQVKCDLYWPQEGSDTYGTIQVTLVSTISYAYYVKRIFSIRCKANRKVYIYIRVLSSVRAGRARLLRRLTSPSWNLQFERLRLWIFPPEEVKTQIKH